MRILVSAGEASGDLYASQVVAALKQRYPQAEFFGCAGPRMQAAGVEPVVDQHSLAVVGIVEVLAHIPRIYGEFRKLLRAARERRPDIAILTDSPDFHLRVAKKLHRQGVPVVYLIAPQAWAWREGRVKTMRATIDRLLCIFPFEQAFFEKHGVPTTYIGHPLARLVQPKLTRAEYCAHLGITENSRILLLLPGSRRGEMARHMPVLLEAVERIRARVAVTPVLALPAGFGIQNTTFWEPIRRAAIQVVEGKTWDSLGQAELALAASGTVTMEAAMLGVPMVSFYKVNELSWILGRWLVRAPHLTMVNLVAGKRIVPELIQKDMTAEAIAAEAIGLLEHPDQQAAMRAELAQVAAQLASERDPMEVAAEEIGRVLERRQSKNEGRMTVNAH